MGTNGKDLEVQFEQLRDDIRVAVSHEQWLDDAIGQMQSSLQQLADDESNQEYAFVTHDDINGIATFAMDTVIAIKAPSGTTLEVPDPDEGMEHPQRRYQIYLKSQTGPVEVFLVSPTNEIQDGETGERNQRHGKAVDGSPTATNEVDNKRKMCDELSAGSDGDGVFLGHSDAAIISPTRKIAATDRLIKLSPVSRADDYLQQHVGPVGVSELYSENQ